MCVYGFLFIPRSFSTEIRHSTESTLVAEWEDYILILQWGAFRDRIAPILNRANSARQSAFLYISLFIGKQKSTLLLNRLYQLLNPPQINHLVSLRHNFGPSPIEMSQSIPPTTNNNVMDTCPNFYPHNTQG